MIMRIRSVKPELHSHPLLNRLEDALGAPMRYYYIAVWQWSDREGRFEWKPDVMRMGIEPHRPGVDFERVLNTFANTGFVVKYRVGLRDYGWVPRFLVHQNINGRETASALPPPPVGVDAWHEARLLGAEFSVVDVASVVAPPVTYGADPSDVQNIAVWKRPPQTGRRQRVTTPATRHALNRTEQNGTERNGTEKERTAAGERPPLACPPAGVIDAPTADPHAGAPMAPGIVAAPVATPAADVGRALVVVRDDLPTRALPAPRERSAAGLIERLGVVMDEVTAGTRDRLKREQLLTLQADLVFGYWSAKHGHKSALPDPKRLARIKQRLDENHGNVSELCYAIDGALHDPWLMGKDERSTRKYDDVHHILRDRAQVERLAGNRKKYLDGIEHPIVAKYAAAITAHVNGAHHNGNGTGHHDAAGAGDSATA